MSFGVSNFRGRVTLKLWLCSSVLVWNTLLVLILLQLRLSETLSLAVTFDIILRTTKRRGATLPRRAVNGTLQKRHLIERVLISHWLLPFINQSTFLVKRVDPMQMFDIHMTLTAWCLAFYLPSQLLETLIDVDRLTFAFVVTFSSAAVLTLIFTVGLSEASVFRVVSLRRGHLPEVFKLAFYFWINDDLLFVRVLQKNYLQADILHLTNKPLLLSSLILVFL